MYFVTHENGAEVAVQLAQVARGQWRASTPSGGSVDLELRGRDAEGNFVVLVNGEVRSFSATGREGGVTLVEGGAIHELDVAKAADLVLETTTRIDAERADVETLTSPITGIILAVPTREGAAVERGETVVVVEAMKMENSLGAPRSGKVVEVFVTPGQTVFVGDPLVRFQ